LQVAYRYISLYCIALRVFISRFDLYRAFFLLFAVSLLAHRSSPFVLQPGAHNARPLPLLPVYAFARANPYNKMAATPQGYARPGDEISHFFDNIGEVAFILRAQSSTMRAARHGWPRGCRESRIQPNSHNVI